MENNNTNSNNFKQTGYKIIKKGISFGSCLAMVISFTVNHSVLWAIIHGLLSWIYVIYYLFTR